MAALELVRCGCGLVRNDEDAPAPLCLEWFNHQMDPIRYELPRACRGCGALYILPRPSPPSSPSSERNV